METHLLNLSSNVLLCREKQTVMSMKTVKKLMDYIKGLIQVNNFQHRLDTLSVQQMSKGQWN